MAENGWHKTKIRVKYKDTDRMGVVYYGNYLTYFEVGRTELMRDLGFPYSDLEAAGYALVVTEATIKYHANVGYDSMITIKTAVTDMRKVRIRFDYEIVSEDNKLLASGYTIHACLDSNQKPSRMPQDMKERIEKHIKN